MNACRGRWPPRALAIACVGLGLMPGAPGAEIPAGERRSGYEFMSRETRAMQDDDVTNPGMLWVLDGEALWNRKDGAAARACADCHGDARASMKGVAARHPAWDAASGRPVNLEHRINACRTRASWAPQSTHWANTTGVDAGHPVTVVTGPGLP